MAINTRITDLTRYTGVLPYASEMFGVYQPLLGWRSKRTEERFQKGFAHDKSLLLTKMQAQFRGLTQIHYKPDNQIDISIKSGVLQTGKFRPFDSLVLQEIASMLPPEKVTRESDWNNSINEASIKTILEERVVNTYKPVYTELLTAPARTGTSEYLAKASTVNTGETGMLKIKIGAFESQLEYESSIAGALLFLAEEKKYGVLNEIFYNTTDNIEKARKIITMLSARDSIEAF